MSGAFWFNRDARFEEVEQARVALKGASMDVPDISQFMLELAALCPMTMMDRCRLAEVALTRGLDDSCLWAEPFPLVTPVPLAGFEGFRRWHG